MKKLNLNDHIKVKLTDFGKDIYYHQYDELNFRCGKTMIEPRYPEVDENGFSKFQLWHFMEIYGKYLWNGMPHPIIDRNSIYIEDSVLEEVSDD